VTSLIDELPDKWTFTVIHKHSVPISNKTQRVSMTTISWSMLFKEIIAVYSENHTKPINTLCGQNADLLIIKSGGTHHYHRALKV
jgi:hypothetical protein